MAYVHNRSALRNINSNDLNWKMALIKANEQNANPNLVTEHRALRIKLKLAHRFRVPNVTG